MRRLLLARWWHPVVSGGVAAAVAAVTNLATATFSWTLITALVALVVVQAVLLVRQARQDHRAARDAVLAPLRPAQPDVPPDAAQRVVHWLTAPFTPTPLWGRAEVCDRLLAWCRDPAAGVVRVVTGPAGVGKSRLALEVAESLPPRWAAGRLQGGAEVLVERIVAAGDPTLIIVDDADRVPDRDMLVSRALRHPELIRLLLLTRTEASLRTVPDGWAGTGKRW